MQGEGALELPKYVRYDFLITLLGIFCIGTWWYFSNVIKVESEFLGLFFVIGIWFLIWGLGDMYSNYREERDLSQLRSILEKKEIFDELTKHKILNKSQNSFLVGSLKQDIKDIIEKKKEDKNETKKKKS